MEDRVAVGEFPGDSMPYAAGGQPDALMNAN